ncbi:hypothetical protein ACH5RR_008314 [Cinchona calisaya]|uniref:Glycine-rich protein n=1 Tax=Cinchona calisaya TaxID=153742 RepID=A0ABD3AEU8_9GENT
MRKILVLWFFTLLCVEALYGLSLNEVHIENKESKLSKDLLVAQENQGTYGSGYVNLHAEGDDENLEGTEHVFDAVKARRGKGSNGGANLVHHPRNTVRAAASVLDSPFGFSLFLILPQLII